MDAKSELHACCIKRGLSLKFQTIRNDLIFVSKVVVESFDFSGTGEGSTKKLAEKNASQNFLDHLKAAEELQVSTTVMQQAGRRKDRENLIITDAKSFLCHWCSVNNAISTYGYSCTGEPHQRIFYCSVKLETDSAGELYRGEATATSKKGANHVAAKKAVKHLLAVNLVAPDEVKRINLDLPENELQIPSVHQRNLPIAARDSQTDYNVPSVLKAEKSKSCFPDKVQVEYSQVQRPGTSQVHYSQVQRPSTSQVQYSQVQRPSTSQVHYKQVQMPSTFQYRRSFDTSSPRSSHNISLLNESSGLTKKMDSLNMDSDKSGNWDISTAKSRLNQFLQENNISADYTYTTDCYDLEGYHVAFMKFYVRSVGRTFRATGNATTKTEASKKCALSIVRQLCRENLIEAYSGTLKKDKPMPAYKKPIELSVPDDLVGNFRELCVEFGEDVPELIPNESGTESIVLSSLALDLEDSSSIGDIMQPKCGGTRMNWNPWTARQIQEDECDYDVSLRDLSRNMKSVQENTSSTETVQGIQWDRQNLPIFRFKEEILNTIDDHPVVIVKGSTGCGKSTQVCQYILDEAIENNIGSHCNIVVIEPRRICATSLAERVAYERAEQLGQSVGYCVRFDSCFPRAHGAVLYCTAGAFIRKLENGLSGISHIIVDEVHERNVEIDYILIILRKMLDNASPKVILMSANIDINLFSSYFDGCPHVSVIGHTHPVKDYFLEDCIELINFKITDSQGKSHLELDSEDDFPAWGAEDCNISGSSLQDSTDTLKTLALVQKQPICFELIEAIILWFREQKIEGSILVFLPGLSEIRKATKLLQESKFSNYYCILPLHSKLKSEEQRQVFRPAPNGKTKVILSTNLAESSVTIDDVVCVIDSCKTRVSRSQNNLSFKLVTEWASKVSLEQRLGRVGRVRPGYCFRLCTKARYENLPEKIEPEIFRTPLYNVALSIKLLKLGSIRELLNNAIEPPQPHAIEEAERLLIELKCLDDQKELTPLGNILARLPLDPRLGRMVLVSMLFNCTDQMLKLAAYASSQEEFFMEFPTRDMSYIGKERFSDHIAVLYALSTRKEINHYQFSQKISSGSMIETLKAEEQLYSILERLGFDLTPSYGSGNKNMDIVTALLCQGFYPNVCFHDKNRKVFFSDGKFGLVSKKSLTLCSKDTNFISPSSPIFVYGEMNETYIKVCRNLTMVTPIHLLCFTNCKVVVEKGFVKIDDWLTLHMDPNTAALVMSLRSIVDNALLEIVADPTSLDQPKMKRLTTVVSRLCKIDFDKEVAVGAPMRTSYEQLHSPQRNFYQRPRQNPGLRAFGRGNRSEYSEYNVPKNHNNGCLWLRDAKRMSGFSSGSIYDRK